MPHCYSCQRYRDKQYFSADQSRILKVASLCKDCANQARRRRRRRAKLRTFLAQMAELR